MSRSSRDQVEIKSRSSRDQVEIKSRSNRDQDEIKSRSNRDKVEIKLMFPFLAIDTKLGSDNCWCSESRNQSKSCENLQGSLYKNRTKFYMSGNDWIQINEFCKKVGWNFLFDFNVLKRNRKGNWRYVPKINFPIFSSSLTTLFQNSIFCPKTQFWESEYHHFLYFLCFSKKMESF